MPDAAVEDRPLTEEEILSEGLLLEESAPKVIIPKKGKLFEEDGTCKVAIIRPCVSRGKRLRGLPPIYTPNMLAENASVFSGWLMYTDHLTERIVELLQERGRSIRELGGRLTKSYYDPEMVFEGVDEEYGYQKGGVAGRALPQPLIRTMLEADPEILHVSINAYPTGVKPGNAPWNPSQKGMLIEGIRNKPPGTVDWVPRGGAGGRVLQESENRMFELLEHALDRGPKGLAVSIPNLPYDPARGRNEMPDYRNMSAQQLREELTRENPALARELGIAEAETPPAATPPAATPPAATAAPAAPESLTESDLEVRLAERDAEWESKLAEREESVQEAAERLVQERDEARARERLAHTMIKRSGLGATWQADLLRRYSVLPSGPSPALLVEAAGDKSAEDVLKEAVEADLQHAASLIEEASGRRPRVIGLGGGNAGGEDKIAAPRNSAFRDFLRESGDTFGEKAEDFEAGLREMVREGVTE